MTEQSVLASRDADRSRPQRQSRGRVRRIPILGVVDVATFDAVNAASLQRSVTRSMIVESILREWAARQKEATEEGPTNG
jgi:hypothetical protein